MGASAGGLEAYTELLNALPGDTGMAFVLIQHLPTDRESILAELLSRQMPMPVWEVTDWQAVEPNSVYVIRPGHTLTIQDGKPRLGADLAARGHGLRRKFTGPTCWRTRKRCSTSWRRWSGRSPARASGSTSAASARTAPRTTASRGWC